MPVLSKGTYELELSSTCQSGYHDWKGKSFENMWHLRTGRTVVNPISAWSRIALGEHSEEDGGGEEAEGEEHICYVVVAWLAMCECSVKSPVCPFLSAFISLDTV